MSSPIKRISKNMATRLERYADKISKEEKRRVGIVEASKRFADNAVLPNDNLNESLNRIGKKWRFR